MNVPDDDDLARMLDGVSDAPEPPKPALKPLVAVNDEDDFATFLSSTGLKAEREVPDITKPWMRHHEFVRVQTPEEVEAIVEEALACGRCSLDLETEGLDNRINFDAAGTPRTVHQIVGFCIAVGAAKKGYYIPVRHAPTDGGPDLNVKPLERVEAAITRLCREAQPTPAEGETDPLGFRHFTTPPRVTLDFWNAKFDQEFLYPVTGIDYWHPDSFEDGLLAHFTLYSGDKRLGLKGKAEEILRSPDGDPYEMIELKELFPNKRKILFPSLSPDEPGVVKYAGSDAICTRLLCDRPDLLPVINADPGKKFTYRLEKQVSQVVRVMERNRAKINRNKLTELRDRHRQVREEYREKIIRLAASKGFENFEPGSPKQLSDFLFGERGLNINPKPPMNEKSGQYKTDYDTLDLLGKELGENAPEVLKWVISYREEDKVLGTYLESLSTNADANDELRFQFKQTGAATGRFSAPAGDNDQGFSGIPIHGIPSTSDIRQCFVARDGYTMVKCDYAGQELRIVTNLSNEPVWVKEFVEGDGDLHSITARAFFNKPEVTKDERAKGKTANFALVYGGGPAAIMRATGCDKLEGQRRKQAFDKAVPTFANWVKGQHEKVKRALGVYTAFGRWVAIPDANCKKGEKDSNGRLLFDDDAVKALRAACERHATNYPIQGCLNACSSVLTDQGYKSIGDLEAQGTDGLRVWTGTKWATFTAHNMGRCQLADVHLADGTHIQCDTRHKLLVVTDEGYSWVEYADLKLADRVATSLCQPVETFPTPLSPVETQPKAQRHFRLGDVAGLWYWLGRYMGDGWLDPRGGLVYAFGSHEQTAIDACVAFWQSCGLNPQVTWATHNPAAKTSTRARVEVWGVELTRWLEVLGFKTATAHTKRLPARVFQETLENRSAFMRGFMDSDGHRPSLVTAKGNPYNLHLCQRELLADTKLLLRSLGVESCLRGPYQSNHGEGAETTSYRLDIQRRMFEQNVMGRTDLRHAKFHDMFAPAFLVRNLLLKGAWVRRDFSDESLYTMYLRLKAGGKVSVYTLDRMCKALGVTLDYPIYGFKRLVSKTERAEEDETFTLSVDDPLHRFEADGVITKNSGADIMKIAMVLLHKEFYRRGWLRHQTDAVRMLLSVHDELVFEVRHDLVFEAIPVLTEEMERPTLLARHPYSPKWKVPLVTEPLLGESWGAEYGCHRAKSDEKLKEGGFIASGYVYGKIPASLQPFIPAEGGAPQRPELTLAAPVAAPLPTTEPSAPQTPPAQQLGAVAEKAVATVRLNTTTVQSIAQVRMYVGRWMVRKGGHILRLTDKFGVVLIDPNLRIRVNAQKFAQCLLEANLSDGKVGEESLS